MNVGEWAEYMSRHGFVINSPTTGMHFNVSVSHLALPGQQFRLFAGDLMANAARCNHAIEALDTMKRCYAEFGAR